MAAERMSVEHIEATPGVCGGRPRIAGHRIRVQDVVVWHEWDGLSADEIVSEYPTITLADVHAALAYYFDHRETIDRQIREDWDFVERMRSRSRSVLESGEGRRGGDAPAP